jgi:predicted small metal-binding protein
MTNLYSYGCKCGASTTSETNEEVHNWARKHYVDEHYETEQSTPIVIDEAETI